MTKEQAALIQARVANILATKARFDNTKTELDCAQITLREYVNSLVEVEAPQPAKPQIWQTMDKAPKGELILIRVKASVTGRTWIKLGFRTAGGALRVGDSPDESGVDFYSSFSWWSTPGPLTTTWAPIPKN